MKRRAALQAGPAQKRHKPNSLAKTVVIPRSSLPNPEKKNIDNLFTNSIVAGATAASLHLLNGVDDGATAITRIGRRISMSNLSIRWLGNLAATSAGASPLRLVVVYDRQTNAQAPAVTDVFQVDQISTMMNLANARRFKVIVDENVECVGTGGPQAWSRMIFRDFTQGGRKPGLAVEFNTASTANVDSITTGSIYAFLWQTGGIITAAPTQALFTRVRFTDN